jgi:hypothetical protein
MVNIFEIENKAKKDMIEWNLKINEEFTDRKREKDVNAFLKKQELMKQNSEFLYGLKQKFSDDLHQKQMDRMQRAFDLKLFQPKVITLDSKSENKK